MKRERLNTTVLISHHRRAVLCFSVVIFKRRSRDKRLLKNPKAHPPKPLKSGIFSAGGRRIRTNFLLKTWSY